MTEAFGAQELFEKMFEQRFTDNDQDYQEYLKREQDQPPVVEDWKMGNQRNTDRYRDNRHHRGWDGRQNWSSNSYNQSYGRGGWGNSYNQYRQDRPYYPQGRYTHNPSNQRFHSDRY
ncbi:RNA guanine-N7 methyltransferase activating subunit [Xenopus laevis]|uniref:RNMT-activating mini protein n=2 Tax=Xenopus laevis TaxID=8355 RepID=A0A974DEQ8_XENLA|nr:RNA guanine-N7 methyltransferase activating subunit [Xenopus laevis]OCT89651.1 hypothetical protein XELAEV_18018269mg [Xenopus laevis]